MAKANITIMTTDRALAALLAWTSPSYPVGAFSYSHGLEAAVEDGSVGDAATLVDYVDAVIARGGGWVDAVLFANGWRIASEIIHINPAFVLSDVEGRATSEACGSPRPSTTLETNGLRVELTDLAELALAFRGSSETALESRQMGSSFLSVTRRAWPSVALDDFAERQTGRPVAHCIAGAVACAAHGVPLREALIAWLHGTAANLVSAGVRLVPLGQTDGQIATARLSARIGAIVDRALVTELDDLGTSAPLVELASLAHETQYTRLFRS